MRGTNVQSGGGANRGLTQSLCTAGTPVNTSTLYVHIRIRAHTPHVKLQIFLFRIIFEKTKTVFFTWYFLQLILLCQFLGLNTFKFFWLKYLSFMKKTVEYYPIRVFTHSSSHTSNINFAILWKYFPITQKQQRGILLLMGKVKVTLITECIKGCGTLHIYWTSIERHPRL